MEDNSRHFERALAQMTKRMVVNCVRTPLEPFHAGRGPVSKAGDMSDVRVVDAEGNEIPYNEVSRISDPEMKQLMQQVVDRTYTFLMNSDDPEFIEMMSQYDASTSHWDTPKLDEGMLERKYFRLLRELEAEES